MLVELCVKRKVTRVKLKSKLKAHHANWNKPRALKLPCNQRQSIHPNNLRTAFMPLVGLHISIVIAKFLAIINLFMVFNAINVDFISH